MRLKTGCIAVLALVCVYACAHPIATSSPAVARPPTVADVCAKLSELHAKVVEAKAEAAKTKASSPESAATLDSMTASIEALETQMRDKVAAKGIHCN